MTLSDKLPPIFTYTMSVQEISCKVAVKDETFIEGDPENITKAIISISFCRHDEPDIAETGHYWQIVQFQKMEGVK